MIKMNKNAGLAKRIAWAIEAIKTDKSLDKGIQDVELAKILGTNKNTLAAYRNGKGLIKGEFIERLISHYNFSPDWLFKGTGEPYPGTVPKPAPKDPLPTSEPEQKLSDLLHKTTVILESDTVLNRLFRSNIELFYHLITSEEQKRSIPKEEEYKNALLASQDIKLHDQHKKLLELERKIEYLARQTERQPAAKGARKNPKSKI